MNNSTGCIEILAFSGKRTAELAAAIKSARRDLTGTSGISALGSKTRSEFDSTADCRLLLTAADPEALSGQIDTALKQLENSHPESSQPTHGIFFGKQRPEGKLALVFPGQGSQYPYMGSGLKDTFSEEFRRVIRAAEQSFDRHPPLLDHIYPESGVTKGPNSPETAALRETDVAQPAIGAVSLIMLKILQRHGVYADAACGHSFGELTALCAGGRIRETDFMELAVARGKLMAEAGRNSEDKGGMLAVKGPIETIEAMIRNQGADLVLANRNSPTQGVLSGPSKEIEKIQEICRKNKIISAKLPVSAAFHSRLIMDAATPFRKIVYATPFLQGNFPVYSNTTAVAYPEDHAAARARLGEHLAQPVNFIDEITNMHEDGVRTFIEVGPGAVLTGLIKQILPDLPHTAFSIDGSKGKQPALLDLASALCRIAAIGYPVDLHRWPSEQ